MPVHFWWNKVHWCQHVLSGKQSVLMPARFESVVNKVSWCQQTLLWVLNEVYWCQHALSVKRSVLMTVHVEVNEVHWCQTPISTQNENQQCLQISINTKIQRCLYTLDCERSTLVSTNLDSYNCNRRRSVRCRYPSNCERSMMVPMNIDARWRVNEVHPEARSLFHRCHVHLDS